MAICITLAHQKGGVGKTTLTLNLYDYFQSKHYKCVLLDADAQGSVSDLLSTFDDQEHRNKVEIIKYDSLSNLEKIAKSTNNFDFVFVDTPPYLSKQLPAIFKISDLVVIPCKASPLDALAIAGTIDLVEEAKKKNSNLKSAIVLNMTISGTDFNKKIRNLLQQKTSIPIFESEIGNRVVYARSLLISNSVLGDENSKAKEEISNLANEIINFIS